MRKRIEKLRALLKSEGLDAAMITSGENIRYFSGFTSDESLLLISLTDATLFTDFRYLIQARGQLPKEVSLTEYDRTNKYEVVLDKMQAFGVSALAFEEGSMTVGRFEKLKPLAKEWKPLGSEISKLRLIKSDEEIVSLQKAQAIADKAYTELLKRVKAGMSELDVVAELNYLCTKFGSEGPSFDPIVGSGPNGAMCHAVPGERKLTSGDLVVVDFGCIKDGYHSDMTRTFGVGNVDDELKKIYGIVQNVQQTCLDALKPGITGKELDGIARGMIAKAGYGDCFGHGLGHGVGLLIHEAPSASVVSTDTFESGMTITVEPGIYLEGHGGVRIEDCCVLTKDGHINFGKLPKDLIIL